MKNLLLIAICFLAVTSAYAENLFPKNKAININPDTHLILIFDSHVTIGKSGFIRVFDRQSGKQVDSLDMSIPAGPTESQPGNPDAVYTPVPYKYESRNITNRNTVPGTPSGVNKRDTSRYQLNIIGGFSDGFHFYPIIVNGNKVTIYLHNNMLEYGHSYYVTIDHGVINTEKGDFHGIKGQDGWGFTIKKCAPDARKHFLKVDADGHGNFNTVQGAMDFIPDFIRDSTQRWTVSINNGDYEELVYFRNKRYVSIEGESRDSVMIHYANNEVFNPHPIDIKTNELKGTFPSRRAAFAADNCRYMQFRNLTLKTDLEGQAEGFLLNGEHNTVENVHVIGSGDALQVNGSTYWHRCVIDGGGDTVLGRGPSFFDHCTLSSYGAFLWIRNTQENHGDIFLHCTFKGKGKDAVIARSPVNKGKSYPYAEAVLINCTLDSIPAAGWGPVEGDTANVHFWEYNSRYPNGKPVDVSLRHKASHQLNDTRDKDIISKLSDYKYVLGWE